MLKTTFIYLDQSPIARMNEELHAPQYKIHYKGEDYLDWDIVDDFSQDGEVVRTIHLKK